MKKLFIFIILFALTGCTLLTEETIYTVEVNPSHNTLSIGEEFVDAGVILVPNDDTTNITVPIVENNIDNTTVGEYTVIYQLSHEGKTYTANRVIHVIDSIFPVVTLNPGLDTIQVNTQHIDAGVTATDNLDTDLEIEVYSNVDVTKTGTYTITYVVTDDYYNQRTIIRYIHIID